MSSSLNKRETILTALDLFSGCGGMTQGLRDAGFHVLGAVDNDALSVRTYHTNHPDTKIWHQDIRALDPSEMQESLGLDPGQLDLLAGCPPCQGFSSLRTRNGAVHIKDPRNDLTGEMLRFAKALKPRTVMMENVPGLWGEPEFMDFIREMTALGYVGQSQFLNAADYSVPQRRRRLVYLAGFGASVPFASSGEAPITVRDALGHLLQAGQSNDRLHDWPERRSPRISALIRRIPKDGGSRTDLPEAEQLACHRRCQGFRDVYGRMAWDRIAPTITSGCINPSKGRFLHPEENRAITLREAAILQGFSETYQFPEGGKGSIAALIGNALPPPFIAALSASIRRFLQDQG